MTVSDLIRFQSDMQQTLLTALREARDANKSPEEMLQYLAQEVTHVVLTSEVASVDAKALYKSTE